MNKKWGKYWLILWLLVSLILQNLPSIGKISHMLIGNWVSESVDSKEKKNKTEMFHNCLCFSSKMKYFQRFKDLEKCRLLQYSCLKIPWTEEPDRLQSMGSLRVGHDWATSLSLFIFIHWRRKWQPAPVFLPGGSQGQRSLVGCRLWGRTESDTTEVT